MKTNNDTLLNELLVELIDEHRHWVQNDFCERSEKIIWSDEDVTDWHKSDDPNCQVCRLISKAKRQLL